MRNRSASRIIKLDGPREGALRLLSGGRVELADGKTQAWVTLTRMGEFGDPRYGRFSITREMLMSFVSNFNNRVLGQDIFIDVSHRPDLGSAGTIKELQIEGTKLRASVEFTPYGIDAVRNRGYRYFSVEYCEAFVDNEAEKQYGPTLFGAGLTIRPVIKHLDPVILAEPALEGGEKAPRTFIHPDFQNQLLSEIRTMWKQLLDSLRAKLVSMKLAESVIDTLITNATLALGTVTEEDKAKVLLSAFEGSAVKLAEAIGGEAKPISVNISAGSTGISADDVKKLLAEESKRVADEAKALADTLSTKRKLLSDTIAADKGLPDAMKVELAETVADLVNVGMTDDQVKRLAAAQIAQGNRLVAAQKLSQMGFQRAGTVHIELDESNAIKALQEKVDKRLGFEAMPKARRFDRTGGELPQANQDLADKVLAQYDAMNAHRLHEEAKLLSSGSGVVSDVSVPSVFERTVIRESLYALIGTQFVDVGTSAFANSVGIPYSYRDTAAAGTAAARRYERQAIQNAGVIQAIESAYPIPQKIAFSVSDEVQYLTQNGQLDWNVVTENVRNAGRIIGEDSDSIMFTEVLDACDQFGAVAVTGEVLTASVNGTNTIFPVAGFPVLRPKKIFDLQGTQVGSTLYDITVSIGGSARPMYDGTNAQSAGNYWKMAWNRGELQIVNQLGVPVALANATALTISYTKSTNVYQFSTDNGATELGKFWNTFLYRYGLRKSVIENDRYFTANFGLMSAVAMNQVEQAEQFMANFQKNGTDLQMNGNLGRIKDVPNFKSAAPGLFMGDERVIIGQAGVTRWRMAKPWSMNAMENERDSTGKYLGAKSAYGDQFVFCMTPTPLKRAYTSIVLYSASARVARVS